MSSPLDLYQPRGSVIDSKNPVDPARCPVMVSTDMGRVSRSSQCKNKPKPDLVRPVRNWGTNEATDMPVCGMHARQYDKRVEERRRWQEDLERDRANDAKARKGVADLLKWGIAARPLSGGDVGVKADQVIAALEAMRERR